MSLTLRPTSPTARPEVTLLVRTVTPPVHSSRDVRRRKAGLRVHLERKTDTSNLDTCALCLCGRPPRVLRVVHSNRCLIRAAGSGT